MTECVLPIALNRRVTEPAPLLLESAVPGVLPAPVLLKERSKSSVVRANPAGVFGVPNACGFGDFGVRGVRLGSVGVCVANRFATAVSCA